MKDPARRYAEAGLIYYTPREEFIHILTHALGALAAPILLVFMLRRATGSLSIAAAVVSCFLLFVQFAASAVYHAERDLRRKRVFRSLDYPAVSLNVLACGTMFSLLYHRTYGYVAYAVSFALVTTVLVLCMVDFVRFKPLGVVAAFVVGALMFGSFLSAYLSEGGIVHKYPVVWLHLAGLLSSLSGAAVFGVHRPYMHAVFHVFVLVGPILCMVGNLLQLT